MTHIKPTGLHRNTDIPTRNLSLRPIMKRAMFSVAGHNTVWTGFKSYIMLKYRTVIREGPV